LSYAAHLRPEDLGDLLDQPRNAIIAIHRADGSILLTPVWHLFRGGAFHFQVPGDDRKIGMLQRDPRISLLVAEDEHPYRGIEVSGVARVSADGYADIGRAIVQRYVAAFDPGADPADYLLEGGVVVRLEATIMRAWDYADAVYV
jgi:PPOX class probable F420-dependent enzyme